MKRGVAGGIQLSEAIAEVRATDELHTGDLRATLWHRAPRRCRAPYVSYVLDVCFKIFQRYVTSVSYGCCKSRSGCCICCSGCTRMLQAFVPNVSSIFLDVSCKCVYLDVAYVYHIYCKCFIWMLCMFLIIVFSGVLHVFLMHVSSKCFICL